MITNSTTGRAMLRSVTSGHMEEKLKILARETPVGKVRQEKSLMSHSQAEVGYSLDTCSL